MNKLIERIARLASALTEKGLTMGAAESCTGGLISSLLTDQSGSSAWFQGAVVAYANEVKTSVLGVSAADLAAHGAVSQAVVLAMARGAQQVLGCSCACAVSGIAGPTGGTKEKPVGTVWIACAVPGRQAAAKHHFDGDRAAVKRQSALAAVEGLLALLEESREPGGLPGRA